MQLFEGRQLNDGISDNDGVEGLWVAHPGRYQRFDPFRRQNAVVLDSLEGFGPVGRDCLSGEGMKGVVYDQLLGLVMGSMQ